MREDVPSRTAAWVALMRSLSAFLPERLRLADDPYGARFAGRMRALREDPRTMARARATSRLWLRGRLRATVVLIQLRTRVLDDDVREFVRAGGRQLVLLGAGFDCRAWRLADVLEGSTVFEVDHPATQGKKLAVMGSEPTRARVEFVPWDFESEPLDRLAARLGLDGHDRSAPTMTISEGVLPYLTDEATDATFACVSRYSSPGSPFSFTYFDRELLADGSRAATRERAAVRLIGEPFRNGFEVRQLSRWLAARGFDLERDESSPELAARLLPSVPAIARMMSDPHRARRHFASARML